jgi:hypothetical protein
VGHIEEYDRSACEDALSSDFYALAARASKRTGFCARAIRLRIEPQFRVSARRGAVIVSAVGGSLFFWRVLSYRQPIVDLCAFLNRNFALGSFFTFILGIGMYGTTYLVPLFAEKPRFPAGVRAGASGAVDRDSQGPATSRRGAVVSLSGDILFQYRIVADAGAGSAGECACRTCGQIIGYYSFVSVTLNVSKSRPARREAFERDPGSNTGCITKSSDLCGDSS